MDCTNTVRVKLFVGWIFILGLLWLAGGVTFSKTLASLEPIFVTSQTFIILKSKHEIRLAQRFGQRFGLFVLTIFFCQDSTDFREILRDCCPDLAERSSMELLQRYRDEVFRSWQFLHICWSFLSAKMAGETW